jgi:general secretion pathway protein J
VKQLIRQRGACDAGYTLLEMLVALIVFGLVMAGIAQTFRFGLTAWTETTRNTTGPENMAALDAALTSMINQALPGSMTGLADGMAFTTILPPAAGMPDRLADVAFITQPGGTLILRYGPHPAGIILTALPPSRAEPLAQNVASLTISYLAPQPAGSPAWSASWSGKGLPLLIRIHIGFAGAQAWPDLLAAPVNPGSVPVS